MFYLKVFRLLPFFAFTAFYIGCSDDSPTSKQGSPLPPTVEEAKEVSTKPAKPVPTVYVEELDQYQEYFKEQHETSFSHVSKKNWTSYTAGKDGILTKVLLYGKPNYTISEHYGSYMSGFVRANNPDTGPKLGQWSLSREDIINQLALQGLTETDQGWITLQMRGEIPQQAGRMYFIVCDDIGNKRAWFGAFAFAEGNSYQKGRFWLHSDHDLVFRTYVGKTADQIEREQKGVPLFGSESASLLPTNDLPEAPKPMIEFTQNFVPSEATPSPAPSPAKKIEPLYQPATKEPVETNFIETTVEIDQPNPANLRPQEQAVGDTAPVPNDEESNSEEPSPKGTLFERFFKNKNE